VRISFASAATALAIMAHAAVSAEQVAPFAPPAPDAQVGVAGDSPLRYRELPQTLQQTLRQNEERYEQRRLALEFEYQRAQRSMIDSSISQLLDQRAAELEAHAQDTTVDKLLANITIPSVSDSDVQNFYDQHREQLKQPFTESRREIANYLQAQAKNTATRSYLDGLRTKYAVSSTLDPMRQDVAPTGPTRGPTDAPVTIIEFADFQCPYCGRMAPVLRQLLARYPHEVRVVYRAFPLDDIHQDAMHAAVAGVCAAEQGKFWELHDALFADQSAISDQAVMNTAKRIGIKPQPFANCLLSAKAHQSVQKDIKAGNEAGVTGTPGMFINGRFYDGFIPLETISAVVEDELRRHSAAETRAVGAPAAAATSVPVTQR